jgi:hypothetical protein
MVTVSIRVVHAYIYHSLYLLYFGYRVLYSMWRYTYVIVLTWYRRYRYVKIPQV